MTQIKLAAVVQRTPSSPAASVAEAMTESVVLRENVSRFFPLEWPTVDANKLMITKIANGLVNTVMVVSRPRGWKQEEPHQVVVCTLILIREDKRAHLRQIKCIVNVLEISKFEYGLVSCQLGRDDI